MRTAHLIGGQAVAACERFDDAVDHSTEAGDGQLAEKVERETSREAQRLGMPLIA